MSGIAGFAWPDGHLVERMNLVIIHRGPDQQWSVC
jgi:asparagine synthetase B (glutamine-hydrolysing)